ncbi:uncharacterized protein LOC115428186 [Sphaeramia orbicularis]|uniref:uncharacterized protein LOC115428186 n=1 Tax=Sphaeramia orbicularis TaxID=375764 RepID=UPI001180886C|nr:uncharacterized protein LOC115428186 [Sphaeramia orbicularis]
MDLRFLPVLVLGFCLSSSAPTHEECETMVTPKSLEDPSPLFHRWTFVMGFANHSVYQNMLTTTQSSWTRLSQLADHKEIAMHQSNKMNEKCFHSQTNVTIEGNTAKIELVNVTSELQVIPTHCDKCVALKVHSEAKHLNNVLHFLNYTFTAPDVFQNEAFYLMSTESMVEEADLDYFKKQAACLGFHGEPDFVYDPKNSFCEENEGLHI